MPHTLHPDWPALMDLATAGAYLTLAPGTAARLLARENVEPVQVGARLKRWRRSDLDQLVARLADPPGAFEAAAFAAVQGFDWALKAVEARAAKRRPPPRRLHEVRQPHHRP